MTATTTIIIGGVAGGASCAARLRRLDENATIIMLERGPHVSFANCGLPYFVGDTIKDDDKLLVTTPASLQGKFNLDVRTLTEVTGIDRKQKTVHFRSVTTGDLGSLAYDHLVLAPGASPIRPPLPGIDASRIHTVRSVPDAQRVREAVEKIPSGNAIVVGGGFIGIEMAENLKHQGWNVDLLEALPQVMPPLDPEVAMMVQNRLEENGVKVYTGDPVASFAQDQENIRATTAGGEAYQADMVILAIGVKPESTLASNAGLALGPKGHILVDDHMRTEDPDIFAVGDAVQIHDVVMDRPTAIPLAGPANRQGRIAAEVIAGRDSRFRGVQGTAIVGVFGIAAASTGASEKSLKAAGRRYEKIRLWAGNHVGYYPGATPIALKLIFDPENGKILGAQAVGESGADKRIDVIAMAIQMGATVQDLAESELCYAPQFGAAKDIINMAGMVATNVLNGDLVLSHFEDLDPQNDTIIDVRSPAVHATCPIEGVTNIPLDELRNRMDELPKDTVIHVMCNVGQTAYNAVRLLRMSGIDARDITGGQQWYIPMKNAGIAS